MAIRKKHSILKRIISLCSHDLLLFKWCSLLLCSCPSAVKAHFSIYSWMRSISPTIRKPCCFRYIPIIDLGSTFDLSSVLWSMLLLLLLLLLLIYCTVQFNTSNLELSLHHLLRQKAQSPFIMSVCPHVRHTCGQRGSRSGRATKKLGSVPRTCSSLNSVCTISCTAAIKVTIEEKLPWQM